MVSANEKSLWKSMIAGILVAIGLFSAVVFLSNSWIKLLVFMLIVGSGILWLVAGGALKRYSKYTILIVMLFAIIFPVFEGYMLWNAGSPPVFSPLQPNVTISYPDILNASLVEIVQSVQKTPTFSLIRIQYPGEIKFESMTVDTAFRGRIEVLFYQKVSNLGISFSASGGGSYRARVAPFGGNPMSLMYPQEQSPEETLKQFDILGLNWFYDYAIETYQNKTGKTPEINSLQVSVQWEKFWEDNYVTYQGMTLLIIGSYEANSSGSGVFFANFQPNGTLNYLNIAN